MHPCCLARAFIMHHMHHIPIMWWLPGSPSCGCYLTSQIFAGQSEAGIGIRSSKGVNWHYFHVTCIKFELEQSFEGAFFENTLIGLFKLKYTFNKICRLWLSSTVCMLGPTEQRFKKPL